MIAHMESNEKLSPIVACVKEEENSIFHLFLSQSYFKVPITIRLNDTHYFIINIPHKRKLKQIA